MGPASIEQTHCTSFCPLAAPRHPLLQLWALTTLGLVLAIAAGALWWEKQLPERLNDAIARQDFEDCIRTSEQLAALRWLGEGAPEEQALCRQKRAQQLWDQNLGVEAITLQQQLVVSGLGDQRSNRETLKIWTQDLKDQALERFQKGELQAALDLLNALQGSSERGIPQLQATMQEVWNRNQLERERLDLLLKQQRWWEALDSLNRLDHPWWQQQAERSRQQIEQAIQAMGETRDHQQHPAHHPDVIAGAELDNAVQRELQAGLDSWQAFEAACSRLGGRVEEDGPESFCRRGVADP